MTDGLYPGKWWWRWWCALFGHVWVGDEPLWTCDFCDAEFDGERPPDW